MKFSLALFTTLISIAQASARPTAVEQTIEARAGNPKACGDPRVAVPLYRGYQSSVTDHFYTTNHTEMQNAIANLGYTDEGITGYIFSNQQLATVPLYRLYSGTGTDHFYTTSASERDNAVANLAYTFEGVAGYIYPDTTCGLLPLYRSYSEQGIDHFYTMNLPEANTAVGNGWAKEGITGYMFPY